jgi:CelD/BcsL family acetyltransferase involved in cellulose biosynthesis
LYFFQVEPEEAMNVRKHLSNLGNALPFVKWKHRALRIRKHMSCVGYVLPKFGLNRFRADDGPQDDLVHDSVNTRCYTSWPTNPALLEQWEILARTDANATAFHTPAWQHGVGRAYARVGRWRLITLSLGSRLLGALPLAIARDGALTTPGELISDYLDPLLTGIDHQTAWRSILEMVKLQPEGANSKMVLHNVRHDAPCLGPLRKVSASCGFEMIEELESTASRITLPSTWDQFLAKLSGHNRKELRRKIRNAEKAGARLEIHDNQPQVAADLDGIFSMMREVGGTKGLKAHWMYRPLFNRAAPELLRSKHLCVYNLLINDATAAGLICFPSKDGPLMWAGGFNNEMREHSPGIVLFGMAIRDSIEKGYSNFDLLRGHSRYKDELGAVAYPVRQVTLRRAA